MFDSDYPTGRADRVAGALVVFLGLVPAFVLVTAATARYTASPFVDRLHAPLSLAAAMAGVGVAAGAPLLVAGVGIRRGEYGPLAASLAALYSGVVLSIIVVLATSRTFVLPIFEYGTLAITLGFLGTMGLVVVPTWIALSAGDPFVPDGVSGVGEWAWRLGYQPWTGLAGLLGVGGRVVADPYVRNLLAQLPAAAVAAMVPWFLGGVYVYTHTDDLMRSFRDLAADRRDERLGDADGEGFVLVGEAGGLPLTGPRWLTATSVVLDGSALHVARECTLDVHTLRLHSAPDPREIPIEQVETMAYERGRLAMVTADGETLAYRCSERPTELVEAFDDRRRERTDAERTTGSTRVTGRRPDS